MSIHDDVEQILIDKQRLHDRVLEMGAEIRQYYANSGRQLVLVGVLRGAIPFMSDLARAIHLPLEMDYLAVSSYGNTTQSQGFVRLIKDLDDNPADRDILLVEDIIDTGLTLKYVLDLLWKHHPHSVRICALLDKEKVQNKLLRADYVGFPIQDQFVVGYGLDYAQKYRNLPYIGVLKPEIYK